MPNASHSIVCAAPRETVYRIIRESDRWPEIFEPCLAVRAIARSPGREDIEVTALVNGARATWRSRRVFIPDLFGIDSIAITPMPLVESMRTRWRVLAGNAAQCVLLLEHDFEILQDVSGLVPGVASRAAAAAYIARAIETNSSRELANIRDAAARPAPEAATGDRLHRASTILCDAPAARLFDAVADFARWPLIFDSCVSATRIGMDAGGELVRIEAMFGDRPASWTTRRTRHPAIHRVDFKLETPMPFATEMEGQWRATPLGADRALLSVTRSFTFREAAGQPPREAVLRLIDENARAEMLAIKSLVENGDAAFTSVRTRHPIPFPPDRVYRLLAEVRRWPEILPHCRGIEPLYDDGIGQEFTMEIGDGGERFRSVRACDAQALSISYFQPEPPPLLSSHHGSWTVLATPDGCEIAAEHRVRIDIGRCARVFGDTDLVGNKRRVREMIAANTRATIEACHAWLAREAARPDG